MLHDLIKSQLLYGTMDKKDLQEKTNIFFLAGQLTKDEYLDLENIFKEQAKEAEVKPTEQPLTPAQ